VSQYQKGKTNLDFTEARDSEWQWHQLGYMKVCTSLQTDNHASNPPLNQCCSFINSYQTTLYMRSYQIPLHGTRRDFSGAKNIQLFHQRTEASNSIQVCITNGPAKHNSRSTLFLAMACK